MVVSLNSRLASNKEEEEARRGLEYSSSERAREREREIDGERHKDRTMQQGKDREWNSGVDWRSSHHGGGGFEEGSYLRLIDLFKAHRL